MAMLAELVAVVDTTRTQAVDGVAEATALAGTHPGAPQIHVDTRTAPATDPTAIPSALPAAASPAVGPPRRVHARVPDGSAPPTVLAGVAPRVLVLGPVAVQGAHDELVPNRRRRLSELVAYLALHPGATYHQIDEAMWPGARVSTGTRNALVSRARRWLGATSVGEPYLAVVAGDGGYRLHPDVTCDWHDLLRLAQLTPNGAGLGPDRLARALDRMRAQLERLDPSARPGGRRWSYWPLSATGGGSRRGEAIMDGT